MPSQTGNKPRRASAPPALPPSRQRGVALLSSLALITVLTLIAISAAQIAVIQEKMASNYRRAFERQLTLDADATAAARAAGDLTAASPQLDITARPITIDPPDAGSDIHLRVAREWDVNALWGDALRAAGLYHDHDGDDTAPTRAAPGNQVYFGYTNDHPGGAATPSLFSAAEAHTPLNLPAMILTVSPVSRITAPQTYWIIFNPGPPVLATLYTRGAAIELDDNPVSATQTANGSIDDRSAYHACGYPLDGDAQHGGIAGNGLESIVQDITDANRNDALHNHCGHGDCPHAINAQRLDPGAIIDQLLNAGDAQPWRPAQPAGVFQPQGDANHYPLLHVNGHLRFSAGETYGLILVNGDVTLTTGAKLHGLLIAAGDITGFAPTASNSAGIHGAVIAGGNVRLTNAYLRGDSCRILRALSSLPPLVIPWNLLP